MRERSYPADGIEFNEFEAEKEGEWHCMVHEQRRAQKEGTQGR